MKAIGLSLAALSLLQLASAQPYRENPALNEMEERLLI